MPMNKFNQLFTEGLTAEQQNIGRAILVVISGMLMILAGLSVAAILFRVIRWGFFGN